MNTFDEKIYFIGSGAMAEALIRGIAGQGAVAPSNIYVANRNHPERLETLRSVYGITPANDLSYIADCRLVVVATKPGDCAAALTQAAPYLNGQLVISLAAGVTMEYLRSVCSGKAAIVRTMPNIPVAVLQGVTAVSFEDGIADSDKEMVRFLLSQVGDVVEIPESMMDPLTAVSGSGPGFVCFLLEAMEDAAVQLGFTPDVARRLLLQTFMGTVKTLSEWDLSPREMRQRVTSPNGTTHAGVTALENAHVQNALATAMTAAAKRAAEIGRTYASANES